MTSNSQSLPLPPPFTDSSETLTLIAHGAEAQLYQTVFLTPSTPAALKIRRPKAWRHPTLDKRLTRQRILAEARVLVKCARDGVRIPAVLGLDWENGWLATEWIYGLTVKEAIRQRLNEESEHSEDGGQEERLKRLLASIGHAVGVLHASGVIHGDLTTSNMMLRPRLRDEEEISTTSKESLLDGEIYLIDFGLATQAVQEEDRAVDLYVLERAFGSTHPREEPLFLEVLDGYRKSYKAAGATLKRLEDVRMRGRKKSMVG